jgi:hypothetical protein
MQTTDAGARTQLHRRAAARAGHQTAQGEGRLLKHLLAYVAVNTMLIVIWAFTSAGLQWPRGIFWPIFLLVGWGVGLMMHGYVTYRGNVYTEEKIQREMTKLP